MFNLRRRAFGVLLLACPLVGSVAVAQVPPPLPCVDVEVTIKRLADEGATGFERVDYETARGDTLLLFESGGVAMGMLVKKGCVAGWPFAFDYAKLRGEPA